MIISKVRTLSRVGYPNRAHLSWDEFRANKSTFEIDRNKLYRYVEIGSVNTSTGEITANEVLGEDLPANAKRILKKDDVIISKVRTYRGAITIVEESGYICILNHCLYGH